MINCMLIHVIGNNSYHLDKQGEIKKYGVSTTGSDNSS